MAPTPLDIVVVYNTTNTYGLAKDAENLAQGFAKVWSGLNQPIHKVPLMLDHIYKDMDAQLVCNQVVKE